MKISVLIPAHNEENSIRDTINSCLQQTEKFDEIIVVNDGSTDNTSAILESFGDKIKVLTIEKATGNKSYAQEYGLKYVTGDIFVATDGDTILDKDFVKFSKPHFDNPEVVSVAGYVKSLKNNILTACREIDYTIGQDLHKMAQANLQFIFVISGCAGVFRTKIFKKYIKFDHDTLTEDLDFTYKLHLNYFKVVYEKKAVVYTQDPYTLYSYINQMRRWNSGSWQNLIKHWKQVIHRPAIALELSMMYIEGVIFSLALFVTPIINWKFSLHFFIGYFAFMVIFVSYTAIKRKRRDIILTVPFLPVLLYINAWVYLEQFTKEIILGRHLKVWFKPKRFSII